MDILILVLKVVGATVGVCIGIGAATLFWGFMAGLVRTNTAKKIQKRESTAIREYFKNYNKQNTLAIIDETPRPLLIGEGKDAMLFTLRPLKYRQVTRLCVLFAHTLDKLQGTNLDLSDGNKLMGDIVEHCEEDFFRALAIVLYYSRNPKEEDEGRVALGVQDTLNFLKDNITLQQMTMALDIIIMQNDIQKALESFGRYNTSGKKKALTQEI